MKSIFLFFPFVFSLCSHAQNVGVGTINPEASALLHVDVGANISTGFLVTGQNNLSSTVPDLGGSSRMFFYPGKSAFRAGVVTGTQWNNASVGIGSAAFGSGTIASGNTSFAAGIGTAASGINSTAFGNGSTANGDYSFAAGISAFSSGQASTAFGYNTIAKAVFGSAIGVSNDNTDNPGTLAAGTDRIFQIGNGDAFTHSNAITVLRSGNVGLGILNPSNKLHIFNGSSGGIPFSPVFTPLVVEGSGHTYINLLSPDANETAILFGRASNAANGVIMYNNSGNPNSFQFRTNGNVTRMVIYDNGNAWLQGTLTQASDVRLKKDIQRLQNSLDKITRLNGYTYHWKNEDIDPALQMGVLAQEVQKIFPSLVKEDSKGMLAVNYTGLIPVLIESIKEQQKQIDELKKLVEKFMSVR